MTIRVAINGYGRIGRNTLRAFYENGKKHDLEIVAINDLGDAKTNAHLTQYDTAHGKFPGEVSVDGDYLVVNGDKIRVLANRNPAELPWGELGVDVVMECTGFFTSKEKASAHLKGGAKKVIISAPGGKDVDATIVYGVNHNVLKAEHTVISNASCTTNCLAPLVKPLNDQIGLETGLMTTIHAYTNDQVLTDVYHEDLRRARSATHSQIPTKTGAASAVGLVLPELKRQARRLCDPRPDDQRVDRRPVVHREARHDGRGSQRDHEASFGRRAEGHPRLQRRTAGVDRLQPQPGFVDVRRNADQGVGPSRQGVELVRQRVGFLESHARYGSRIREREVSLRIVRPRRRGRRDARTRPGYSAGFFIVRRYMSSAPSRFPGPRAPGARLPCDARAVRQPPGVGKKIPARRAAFVMCVSIASPAAAASRALSASTIARCSCHVDSSSSRR